MDTTKGKTNVRMSVISSKNEMCVHLTICLHGAYAEGSEGRSPERTEAWGTFYIIEIVISC